MSQSEIVVRYEGVDKAFGDNVVFKGMDLEVYKGETITIMGGSGTGKSVALKMLIGLLSADAGDIYAFGERVNDLDEEGFINVRKRISMLFQSGALFDSLNVRDNIAYPLKIHFPKMPAEEIDAKVAEKLELVGLPGIEDMNPNDLSGGMRKRVGLARAIAMEPDVILWDEPTTGLDPINTSRINRLIQRMQRVLKCTSIVVTHDMRSAFEVSDRIAFLDEQRIVITDTVEKVKSTDIPAVRNFIDGRFDEDAIQPDDDKTDTPDGGGQE